MTLVRLDSATLAQAGFDSLGQRPLGHPRVDLEPGRSSSPYHYEYEEEWLLVVDGTVVVRAPDS
jgi:uncharacterized cupin superfamily protein